MGKLQHWRGKNQSFNKIFKNTLNNFNKMMAVTAVLRHGPGGKGYWDGGNYESEVMNAQLRFSAEMLPLIQAEARLVSKMAYTPGCVQHSRQHTTLETRCTKAQANYAIVILKRAATTSWRRRSTTRPWSGAPSRGATNSPGLAGPASTR